jgi:eukaryotic-like serine/threonine-protein kinase
VTGAAALLDGRYSLDEKIGVGGFCEVWRATDTVLTRPVAVKLLHAGYAHQPEARARFRAEARHAGALAHENIARVYHYGEPACGQAYLVMELIGGPSLASVLAGGPVDAARTMEIVAQVAAGLQAAHSAGLIHRDVKPANILFTSEGAVRVTDFGIAYAVGSAPLTATGMVMGTPGYIAPERVAGAAAGPASDLYSLGIVAFECLAGARPFAGPPLEVAIAHRDRPLPPLPAALPTEVAEFVMVLTAKDPAWRPASAGEVAYQAHRLRDRLVSGAIGARPVPVDAPLTITDAPGSQARGAVRDRARNGRSRRPRPLAAAALVALAALTCLMLLTGTGFAPASHPAARPSSGPPQAAPPAIKSPLAASPVTARPAGQQPSATPNATISAAAAARHTSVRHHVPPPGPHHPRNLPGPGNGPPPGPGNGPPPGPGNGPPPGPGNRPGNGPGPGPGNSQETVAVAGSVRPAV